MHQSAMINGKLFFDTYVAGLGPVTVVDIGAQDVNGSLRHLCPANASYIGIDSAPGRGVDIVVTDPYALPFENESVDVVVSSSCLEHSEMFWLVFNEALRILRPSGLLYLNVPSNGPFHLYPVDCWRFYPHSGKALALWAQRCGINAVLLESYIAHQKDDFWNDFVAVFAKDEQHAARHSRRILATLSAYDNGFLDGSSEIRHPAAMPEDLRKTQMLAQALATETKKLALMREERPDIAGLREKLLRSIADIEEVSRALEMLR